MFLFKNFKSACGVLGAVLLLNGCSSVEFPEIVEEDQANVGGRVTSEESNFSSKRTVIKESKSLVSDEKNIAYEGEDEIPAEDKVIPAKTKPVKMSDSSDLDRAEKELDAAEPEFLSEKAPAEALPETASAEKAAPSVSYRLETFYFDNGSSSLDGAAGAKIREIAKTAKQTKGKINVYGYASSRTRNTDIVSHKLANFNISMKRAEAVAQALRRAGVPAKQITVEALSDSAPAYQEVMPEGERLNRRAEVYISY